MKIILSTNLEHFDTTCNRRRQCCATVLASSVAITLFLSLAVLGRAYGFERSPIVVALNQPRVIAIAKEWFHRFQDDRIDRDQLDSSFNTQLTESAIEDEAATLQEYGSPTSFQFVKKERVQNAQGYDFLLTFRSGTSIKAKIIEAIAFDKDGKISGIDFAVFLPTTEP